MHNPMNDNSPPTPQRRSWTSIALAWVMAVAGLWLILFANAVTPIEFNQWGITARSLDGLFPGIVAAPFLHVGIGHLASNTIPLFVLGLVASLRDIRAFAFALPIIVVISGLGAWLLSGSNSITVGASGVVFGLLGYLLGRGVFLRHISDIAIAVFVMVIYGSMLWGVLPTRPYISWQAHLFGFIGGILAAYLFSRMLQRTSETQEWPGALHSHQAT